MWLKHLAYHSQNQFFFFFRMLRALFSLPFYATETKEQLYLIGFKSLFLVILTGIFAGMGFSLAFAQELSEFGAKNYLGRIMSVSIVRELGPVLTGLMVAARVSAGITAEIGSMKASDQLDAMVAFGIDPMQKVVVPRLIALVIMLPALTVVMDVIAIIGGWAVASLAEHVSSNLYWASVRERLTFGNMFIGLLKPMTFSLIIATVSCYKGFTSEGGTKGVGRATTESVVLSSIMILVVNFFLAKVVFQLIKGYL